MTNEAKPPGTRLDQGSSAGSGPSADRIFDYDAPDNHINHRQKLSPEIRQSLLPENVREEWPGHPRLGGGAGFWQSVHRDLLKGSATLCKGLESLLDVPEAELADKPSVQRLVRYGSSLVGFAHHHHEIEDHNYFPQFRALYPNLDRAMTLLDCDHRILDQALNDTELALGKLGHVPVTHDRLAEIYRGGQALDQILNRHIWDEEDIVIPILLSHG